MKKLINQPQDVVEEMLQGLAVLHPGLVRLPGHKVLVLADARNTGDRLVSLVSGGGSGHEPAHAGYIGAGMLSAAVAGEVFTSPPSDSICAAIRAVAGKCGALLIVKNYTGDRLNFGLAAEMARAEGIQVEMVLVDDDVALKDRQGASGARGLAGVVFVHKILGAAGAEGKDLAQLAALGQAVAGSLATMGLSFSAGTSPAVGKPSFELAEDEMELGLGIHGEPGVRRMKVQPADQLTEMLMGEILRHGYFSEQKRVAIMVNNLGATTQMELAIVARHAVSVVASKGLTVERIYAGTFLSSLDMAGVSISVLAVDDERLRLLDAPTTAPAWPNAPKQRPGSPDVPLALEPHAKTVPGAGAHTEAGRRARRAASEACVALLRAEQELTELDRVTGDGDLGFSMARGANTLLASLDSYPWDNIAAALKAIGNILRRELGGSSGPLYGVLFLRCGSVLASSSATGLPVWAEALEQGCQAIRQLGGAKRGDRTMMDALVPFVDRLRQGENQPAREVVLQAVEAAERGADATAHMKPTLGRSSYLGDRVLGHPDPGAKAVSIWLRAACTAYFAA